MSLLLLTSAINEQSFSQKLLSPYLLAETIAKSETNQDEAPSDDDQVDEADAQSGDFALTSDTVSDGEDDVSVTVALPTSSDPEKRTVTTEDPEDQQYFTHETESRDMDHFDLEKGDLSYEGFLNFAIVTAYSDYVETSGAVYVLTDVKSEAHHIIQGLEKPVNVCFDEENEFLYVLDAASDDQGVIYQYEIDWEAGRERSRCLEYKKNKYG